MKTKNDWNLRRVCRASASRAASSQALPFVSFSFSTLYRLLRILSDLCTHNVYAPMAVQCKKL